MEALLVVSVPAKGRELILPLSLHGVEVRQVLGEGRALVAALQGAPVDSVILADPLPDGTAAHWLTALAALEQRPLVLLLLFGIEPPAAVRERLQGIYGPGVEVLAAASLTPQQLAAEAAEGLERLAAALAAPERPVSAGTAPSPATPATRHPSVATPPRPTTPSVVTPTPAVAKPVLSSSPEAPPLAPRPTEGPPLARPTLPQPKAAPPEPLSPVRFGALALLGATSGLGTSLLTANLALLVTKLGGKVLVIDAAFTTEQSQAHLLGAQSDEAQRGLHHLRWGFLSGRPGTPADVAPYLDEGKGGIALLQLPPILDAIYNLPTEQILWGYRAIESEFDLLLFDLGSGISSPRTLALLEAIGHGLLLIGDSGPALEGTRRLGAALEGHPALSTLSLLLREGQRPPRELPLPVAGHLPRMDPPGDTALQSLALKIGLLQRTKPRAPKERRSLFSWR